MVVPDLFQHCINTYCLCSWIGLHRWKNNKRSISWFLMYRCCWPIALLLLILKQSTIARPTIGHRHSDYRILASTRSPPTPLSERSARLGILWPWLVSQSVLGVDMSETVSLWRPPSLCELWPSTWPRNWSSSWSSSTTRTSYTSLDSSWPEES